MLGMAAKQRTMGDIDSSILEPDILPMDEFSVRARAAVELGQQSENALSYLNRKTGNTVDKQASRGTAWPRDDAKTGAICQIVVRDTGFRRGEVLWRSAGLLIDSITDNEGDLHVVSARAGFSDAFAAQYATCLFYTANGTAVAWECHIDAQKTFFPPEELDSPAPAMLSCATLDTAVVGVPGKKPARGTPSAPSRGLQSYDGSFGAVAFPERTSKNLADDPRFRGPTRDQAMIAHGWERGEGPSVEDLENARKCPPGKDRDERLSQMAVEETMVTTDGERNTCHHHRGEESGGDEVGSGGGGHGPDKKNGEAVSRMGLLRPYVIDMEGEVNHAHPQILHLGEMIYLFQPPEVPGGSWEETEATTWTIEQDPDNQVSVKYRVDPRGDRDMVEGCPFFKKIGGRKYVPVGFHLGRYTEKKWTHHGLLLLSGMHQIGKWLTDEKVKKSQIAEGRIDGVKLSYRKLMQERTKAHLSDVVKASATLRIHEAKGETGAAPSPSKLTKLSPEEGEALAEACEGRGVQAVLAIVLSPGEAEVIRRPGLKALARLASDSNEALLAIGNEGGIEAAIDFLKELGEYRDVQENACWLLALLSQVAEFSRRIGSQGGCEEVCKVLMTCARFGWACPRIQSWALGCTANLLTCRDNRRTLLGLEMRLAQEELEEEGVTAAAPERGEGKEAEHGRQRRGTAVRNPSEEEREERERHGEAKEGNVGLNRDGGKRRSMDIDRVDGSCGGDVGYSDDGSYTGENSICGLSAGGTSSRSSGSSYPSGLAGWIHTVLANSDRVVHDRDAQYSGIACVRELAAAGPTPVRVMRSTGVPVLVGAALDRFGDKDPKFREQAETTLRCLSKG